jgi:diguanylate cyclase (GGDEF)-like protein
LQHLAAHDPLTGAADRSEFRDRLARALAIGERNFAVAFCDLDHFKPVNDTFGHQVGDQVLVQVVDRMRSTLRAGDELVRAGGDEFTVLVRNVPTLDAARDVAERLVAVMRAPFDADGHHVHLSISVGVALTDSVHSADELLDLADTALYAVKRAGGDAAALAAS